MERPRRPAPAAPHAPLGTRPSPPSYPSPTPGDGGGPPPRTPSWPAAGVPDHSAWQRTKAWAAGVFGRANAKIYLKGVSPPFFRRGGHLRGASGERVWGGTRADGPRWPQAVGPPAAAGCELSALRIRSRSGSSSSVTPQKREVGSLLTGGTRGERSAPRPHQAGVRAGNKPAPLPVSGWERESQLRD